MNSARRSRRRTATLLAAGAAGSMLVMSLYAVSAANAADTGGPAESPVPQGISLAGVKATRVFPVGSKTKETVSFMLKLRYESELEAKVDAGIRGHFLSVAQFATKYGQPESRIRALQKYLAKDGIKTKVYADHLDVTATGTAGEFNKALSVTQAEYKAKAVKAADGQVATPAVTFRATKDKPLLPSSLAKYVESILGLDNYPVFASNAVRTPWAEPSKAAAGVQLGNRTPANYAKSYGLDALYAKGARGQGQTLGIVTYASVKPSDATHFWSKVIKIKTKSNRIRLDNIDGGSGPVSDLAGSGETTLDVEQSGAVAPQADIVVYQAPNSDYGGIDAYAAVASQDVAGTVSTSWGESETVLAAAEAEGEESTTLIRANDELFLELAAQGQSSFTATGDEGAYAASADLDTTNLSVQSTADSPWTTAAGGTTLGGLVPVEDQVGDLPTVNVSITAQRAWGWDYLWPYYAYFPTTAGGSTPFSSEAAFAVTMVSGDGGGYSRVEPRPGYQQKIKGIGDFTAVPYLTPTAYQTVTGTSLVQPTSWSVWDAESGSATPPSTVTGTAWGRAIPDLSADADPATGYLLYFSGFSAVGEPSLEAGWGGTSFVAPQLNGSAAVIDSYLGHRVGFWNPAIYKFAAGHGSPFTPMDTSGGSNDNIYYTGTAHTVFNAATGLGTPNLAKLAADFARYAR